MKKVLFLCTHNSARSQMAEAYLNYFYGDRFEAHSAGTHPSEINQYVITVMSEENISLKHTRSKNIMEFVNSDFDLVVTVCDIAKESCPFFPGDEIIHHSFRDPSTIVGTEKDVLTQVRKIRNEIKKWIKEFFK